MSQIEVPDWVLEIGADAIGRNMRNGAMTAYERLSFAEVVITAALGAWVVPQHQCMCTDEDDLPNGPRDIWMDVSEDDLKNLTQRNDVRGRTLYDLRQEKPE